MIEGYARISNNDKAVDEIISILKPLGYKALNFDYDWNGGKGQKHTISALMNDKRIMIAKGVKFEKMIGDVKRYVKRNH